ncbi:MAG: hypothetical protein LBJ87_07425 [bacterium]|jgi:predicted DNA-binding protein|nr:hypothetical protein [bacterium]
MQPESSDSEKQVDPQTVRLRNEIEERWARGEETAGPMYRRRRRSGSGDRAVVHTVRMSAEWAERLQAQAEAAGVPVGTLLQQWIEQRIQSEERGGSRR